MINKTNLKYYLIPAGLLLIIFLIVLIVPIGNKSTGELVPSPSSIPLPTTKISTGSQKPTSSVSVNPTIGPSPTLIPLRFTGGDLSQDLPADIKLLAQQKTELRRKTPLTLSFGILSFDYETDKFVLTLNEPKDQSEITFNTWLKQTYPAIPLEQFAIQ